MSGTYGAVATAHWGGGSGAAAGLIPGGREVGVEFNFISLICLKRSRAKHTIRIMSQIGVGGGGIV